MTTKNAEATARDFVGKATRRRAIDTDRFEEAVKQATKSFERLYQAAEMAQKSK
jgi:hypothetical protein